MCENKKNCSCGCDTKKPINEAKQKKPVEKSIILEKVDLKITSNTKRELTKQAKTALDALYTIYDTAEKQNISSDKFLQFVDGAFENVNELLTILVEQQSVEKQ